MLRPISTPARTSKHLPFNKRRTQYLSAETGTIRIYKFTILVHLRSQCPPPAARRHLEKADLGSAVRVEPSLSSISQSIDIRPPQPRVIASTTSRRELSRQRNLRSTRDLGIRLIVYLGSELALHGHCHITAISAAPGLSHPLLIDSKRTITKDFSPTIHELTSEDRVFVSKSRFTG